MAVYTYLTHAELDAFLSTQYDLGELIDFTGIAQGVSNSNYRLITTQGTYILTLYEAQTKTEELPFFLSLMQHLAARGLHCPQPMVRTDGAYYGPLAGKAAAIVSFLSGKSHARGTTLQVASVGEALAQLHTAGADFPGERANGLALKEWRALYAQLRDRLDSIVPDLAAIVGAELTFLDTQWPRSLEPTGIIHADCFPDNMFFEGDRVSGVIDFYYACRDILAYDLAITLNAWCFDANGQFEAEKAQALVAAYQRQRPLSEAEMQALPILLRGAAMRFLLTRCRDWLNHDPAALVTPHDPAEYLQKLQFHQHTPASFL